MNLRYPRRWIGSTLLLTLLLLLPACGGTGSPVTPVEEPAAAPPPLPTVEPAQVAPTATAPMATVVVQVLPPTPTLVPSPPPENEGAGEAPSNPVAPTPTLAPDAVELYLVSEGETVAGIAAQYGLPGAALAAYNGRSLDEALRPGTEIVVPLGTERREEMAVAATAVARAPVAEARGVAGVERVVLPMSQTYQGLNNCAPATTATMLNFYGVRRSQAQMATLQKPNPADVNVTAEEVVASIEKEGLQAYLGYNGTIPLLEALLAHGIPVMTEEWISYDGGMGHFRAVRGYDRASRTLLHNDSFFGPDQWRTYDAFLADWKPYNNKYIVIYRQEQVPLLRALIGPGWEPEAAYELLRATTTAQVAANPNDGYAWWGLGEALVRLNRPEEAVAAFESAIATGTLPWRYQWYRYGYLEALNKTGRYETTLAVSSGILARMNLSEDLRYHRAVAYQNLGDVAAARRELAQALRDNPSFIPARDMMTRLETN